jgi:hypothetical protein
MNSLNFLPAVPTPLSFTAIREPFAASSSCSTTSSALQSPQLLVLNSPRTPASCGTSLSPFQVGGLLDFLEIKKINELIL